MSTIDLTGIILAIIALVVAIAIRYFVPWMRNNLSAQQIERLGKFVRIGVFAAEQIFSSTEGRRKKAYVLDFLKKNGWDVDTSMVDAAIEAGVKEMKIEIDKAQKEKEQEEQGQPETPQNN